MFPDLLLNTHNISPELGLTPGMVTFYVKKESVEIGKASKRNLFANVNQALSSLVKLHAEEYNQGGNKWLDTVCPKIII